MDLTALREKLAQIVADMRGILDAAAADDDRDLTDEEIAKYDALKAEADKVKERIARLEEQEALEADLDASRPAAARQQRPIAGQASAGDRQPRIPGDQPATEFESLAEFMHAVTFRPNDQRLASLYYEFEDGRRGEQRMDTGSAGGYMVPEQFRGSLMEVSPQEARIRPRAFVIPAGTPPDAAITMPALDQTGDVPDNVYGGVTVNWIAEGGQKPETDAAIREIKLEPQEVAGYVTVTDKLLRNWQAAAATIERLLRGAVISAEEHAFMTGVGAGKPLGLVNAGASYVVSRQTASRFSYEDASAMVSRLLMRGGSPVWLLSQSVMPQLLTMRNEIGSPPVGDGSLVWQPNARDGDGNQLLMGYPILWHERSPQLGNKGDAVLADLQYYLIKDGSGPFVAASPHVKFTENKTVIKIFWNVDGQPWLTEPFKQENGYEVSPFVVLGDAS